MKLFWSLDDAIRHSEGETNMAVFAKEVGLSGQRHFLVSTTEEFWDIYKKLPSKKHYEVILPGKPCKLYLDLEFMLDLNISKDGDILTDIIIEVVKRSLLQDFGVGTDLQDVIILDSTTLKKFSRHLIFR